MKRALKKESLHHKKERAALLDITKHPCETRNGKSILLLSTVNEFAFRKYRFIVRKKKERNRELRVTQSNDAASFSW